MSRTETPKPTPSPSPAVKSGLTPSAEALNAVAPTTGGAGRTGKRGLTGVPLGTPIRKGQFVAPGPEGAMKGPQGVFGATQYAAGDGAGYFATLDNQGKIDLLITLSKIPGLYPRKKAPSESFLIRQAQQGVVGIRQEDVTALEEVMRYADTVGEDVKTSVVRLVNNPEIAQGFFDAAGARTGAGKKIALTPADALATELEQSFLDYLDIKVDKKETKAYAKRINDLEKKRGGALTSMERQQLLLDTIQDKAKEVFKDGIDEQDTLLMRKGALGGTYNILRQAYADYGIPVDDKTLYRTAINSVRSKQALENNLNKVALQAEVAMPALKTYIQQGLTPREALGSYVGLYAKMTGTPENQVNIDKLAPVWSNEKVMPFQDWEKYLYSLPEVQNGPVVRQQKLNDARALIRNFIG